MIFPADREGFELRISHILGTCTDQCGVRAQFMVEDGFGGEREDTVAIQQQILAAFDASTENEP